MAGKAKTVKKTTTDEVVEQQAQEVVQTENKAVAVKQTATPPTITFTQDQIDLIKRTVADGATNDELALFMHQAKRTGLDPLARQIYCVKRQGKMTIQTSIDGFRVVAERTGIYAGQDAPSHSYGKNPKKVGEKFVPYKTQVNVYKFNERTGERYLAAVGEAFWDEFKPQGGQDFMWKKMPHVMLAKCAEAQALRKAFPQDLSGLYTDDEIAQTGDKDINGGKKSPEPMSVEQRKKFFALADEAGYSPDDAKDIAKDHYKVKSFNDLNKNQVSSLIAGLNKAVAKKKAEERAEQNQDFDSEQVAQDAFDALG